MDKVEMTFFIEMEGGSRAVRAGWLVVVVQIQCFILAREGRRRNEALLEDEVEAMSSS
jgi:hypothetical protein